MTLVLIFGIGGFLILVAVVWILYEMKPLVLRNPDGGTILGGKDEESILAIMDVAYHPEYPDAKKRLEMARKNNRIIEIPNKTRVTQVARKFYADGRVNTVFTIRQAGSSSVEKGQPIEFIHLVDSEFSGKEVWVDGKYCKKRISPI